MHTLPSVAPAAGSDDLDQHGMAGEAQGQLATLARRFLHEPPGRHRARRSSSVLAIAAHPDRAVLEVQLHCHHQHPQCTRRRSPTRSGTNTIGGDMFAQVMRGTLQDIEIALLVAVIATVLGTLVGALAGFYGGRVDSALMRFVDLIFVIPVLVVLIVLANIVAKQAEQLVLAGHHHRGRLVDLHRPPGPGRLPAPSGSATSWRRHGHSGPANRRLIMPPHAAQCPRADHRERHHHRGPQPSPWSRPCPSSDWASSPPTSHSAS